MDDRATPKIRIFTPETLVPDSELWLTGEQATYLRRVLRLNRDEKVVVFDGRGAQNIAVITEFARSGVMLRIGNCHAREIESPLAIHLIQGISRGGRMDTVIQKATELGVQRISPVLTEYSVVKLDARRANRRHEHWLKIARSACEQCGRNTLPVIDPPHRLDDWLAGRPGDARLSLLLDPASTRSIASLPAPEAAVELLIGPEGGLSDHENAQCERAGFTGVSLGPRILRTETAALAGVAVLQAYWGDMQ